MAAERRFRANRRAGRRRALRPLLAAAATVTMVLGLVWVALYSPFFRVDRVTVKGTSRLSPATVLAAAGVREGAAMLRLHPAAVAERVRRLPAVAAVEVDRRWPGTVVIDVTERRPAAAIATGLGTVLVDPKGVPFATVSSTPPGLLQVQVGAAVPGPGDSDAAAAMAVWASFPQRLRGLVTSVVAPSPDAVSVRLRDGRTVVWGSAADGARKAAVLAALMRSRAHVYDVSTPAVAVTR